MSQTEGYAALMAARAPALLRLAAMLTGDRTEAEDLLGLSPQESRDDPLVRCCGYFCGAVRALVR